MAKIYVSSTRRDLEQERKAVIDWLVAARHQPVHSYIADTETARDSCLKDVLDCDACVLILGHRYGHIPRQRNPNGYSITELEYRCASDAGKPCIVLIPSGVRDIELTDLKRPSVYRKVRAFQDLVSRERRPAIFGDEAQLIAALSASLPQVLQYSRDDRIHEATLANKPLTSLQITWTFRDVDVAVANIVKKGHDDALEYIGEEQGHRDDVQNSAVFREHELYPFLATLSRLLVKRSASEPKGNVVVLFSLDDDRNAVLSFGFVDDEIRWADDAPNSTVDAVSPPSLEIGSHAHQGNWDLRNWPDLTYDKTDVTITWRVDPFTFAKSLSRQNDHAYPTASLPDTVLVAILFDIEQLPFATGNFSLAEDQDFWNCRDDSRLESDYFGRWGPLITTSLSSSLRLLPNNSTSARYDYTMSRVYQAVFSDSYGEVNPYIRSIVLEYSR